MKYYSKINIDKNAKPIYTRQCFYYSAGCISSDEIHGETVGAHSFEITSSENGGLTLDVKYMRMETPKELADRIAKEEMYNANYEAYHAERKAKLNK